MGKALWLQLPRYQKKKVSPVKKHIRRRTKERAKDERIYNQRVKVWLKWPGNSHCHACVARDCMDLKKSTQCHHIRGRVGDLLLDERGWIPVCAECHDWIDRNRNKARELGLLCQKGDWARPFPPIIAPENCLVTAKSMLEKTYVS